MITVTDLLRRAGSSGLGATSAPGVQLQLAANHRQPAINTHSATFPDVEHNVPDISQVDPRRYRRTNILWASPECTWHSGARGQRSDDALPDLFGEDYTLRMLSVPEISAAMVFTTGYQLKGNKREQIRQLGTAVTPPTSDWLFRAVVSSLGGHR